MENNKFNPRFGMIVLMIVAAAASRFLPHPPNFTPIAGMGLFGAAYFSKKYWAYLIPFLALWGSDLILNNVVYAEFQNGFTWFSSFQIWTFLAFGLVIFMGSNVLKKITLPKVLGASVTGSLIFFLLTNFGTWFTSGMYPLNATGLIAAYGAGLPYFWNTLAGDLVYVGVLFGGFELAKNIYPSLALNKA
ncbi:MAG TPA: hypothetical protein ENJ53_05675 [Phaeodactylibacter sp.]|nr:hypothetical protein [Phaeodactylibacter sp.]